MKIAPRREKEVSAKSFFWRGAKPSREGEHEKTYIFRNMHNNAVLYRMQQQ